MIDLYGIDLGASPNVYKVVPMLEELELLYCIPWIRHGRRRLRAWQRRRRTTVIDALRRTSHG